MNDENVVEQEAAEVKEVRGLRSNTLLACVTDEEFEQINSEARRLGFSRSSLVYLMLYRGTHGFTNFSLDDLKGVPEAVGARAVYRPRVPISDRLEKARVLDEARAAEKARLLAEVQKLSS